MMAAVTSRGSRLVASLFVALLAATTAHAAEEGTAPAVPQALAALASLKKHTPVLENGTYSWNTGQYSYDAAGNIIAIGTEAYSYDVDGRLTIATVKSPDGTQMVTRTYGYDAYGNLISRGIPGTTTSIGVDPATNHLNAAGTSYDGAGSVTTLHPPASGTTYHLSYDAVGMPQSTLVSSAPATTERYSINTARHQPSDA